MEAGDSSAKVAVISGGNGMLGNALVAALTAKHCRAVSLSRSSTNDEFSYRCDITDADVVKKTVADIEKNIGPIYGAIHCASAPITRKKISDTPFDDFRSQFEVSVFGGFLFFEAVAAHLKKRRAGVLVGITSKAIDSSEPVGAFGGYVAAKYALRGLLREFRTELATYNIHVHEVAPAFMEGGLNADLPQRLIELMKEKDVHAITTPEKVAEDIVRAYFP